ncbi:hypothetical protein [Caballeronia zhejiangensis]|uniref:Uncharacterized protein n=1 Tax=Caballeronia zhejiangensis TaxID=871203 RepID=A0A656QKR4_9BURK|nr:hypothetical protein [Caballeronia zhejiangensis]KDR31766.1 hypothetical protein BG60_28985 [Caballeronia zhejiangensis]
MNAKVKLCAVSLTRYPLESGGDLVELRGLEEDAVYAAAIIEKRRLPVELIPHIAGSFRDITTGEFVIHVRTIEDSER